MLTDVIDIVVLDMWDYEPEFHGDGEAGECLGCDVPGLARYSSQCMSCGAPVEPADQPFLPLHVRCVGGWTATGLDARAV